MRIGFTFDRVADWRCEALDAEQLAEFDADITIDAIADGLAARGHTVERIGRARALLAALHAGARWDIVFNICEGLRGPGREALVPALLEAFAVPCVFSDSLVLALALHKGHCKRVIRDAGLPTADFCILDEPAHQCLPLPLWEGAGGRGRSPQTPNPLNPSANPLPQGVGALVYPVFVKPVAEGTGKGIGPGSLCRTPTEVAAVAGKLMEQFAQPVLAETYLPGREFTVGIVGTGTAAETVGVMEIHSDATYGFATKKNYADVRYTLADDPEGRAAGAVALAAWRVLGCRDGGRVDLRSDAEGRPNFLEVNPLAGLHPVDSDLVILARLAGHDHAWLLDRIMRSACARAGLVW